eukprot:scaffold207765_cov35-Tisochrysis_lutea.AAC.2
MRCNVPSCAHGWWSGMCPLQSLVYLYPKTPSWYEMELAASAQKLVHKAAGEAKVRDNEN